ncbi:CRISPR-associated protein Csx11 [Candidatus Woesearchaeota archaeon]|nr:MAG: CRISPR-associated protein Csx11 [Candidatus Woesearchaeota archaeon]
MFVGRKFSNFEEFWNSIAERDATGKALTLTNNSEKAKHLIKLLFRKHPSLARIYRVWKTTQEFINETIFEKILKEYNWDSGPRRQRIQFKIEPNPNIPEGATCDIDVDGLRFSPVCINRENGIFVSTINLEILKKFGESANEISENLNERRIKVKTDKDRTWKDGKVVEAKLADEKFQSYLPYVKIYDFPDQFMVLVPAYEALDIAERILDEYEIQFSKVRDRLPFHLGIIAFHRKTPLYVVVDAGKRLLEAFKRETKTKSTEVILIRDVEDEKLRKSKELTIKAKSYPSIPLKWRISYSTGDPDQEDFWHPYIRFDGNVSDRNLCFDYTGNGDYVVHVKEIRKNDKIKIEPSYFRLSYLENAADRFRIDEDLKPLDYIYHLKKLWKEIEDKLKSKTWSTSQIYAYWEEVRKRRKEYDEDTFKKFVRAALINILEIKPQNKEFNLFFQATMDNTLDLCLYWSFQVRKVKSKGGYENERI